MRYLQRKSTSTPLTVWEWEGTEIIVHIGLSNCPLPRHHNDASSEKLFEKYHVHGIGSTISSKKLNLRQNR